MNRKTKIDTFAEILLKEKKISRSFQNTIQISFFILIGGIILALPLRYFWGITFQVPFLFILLILILSFIYGFLGIENKLDILIEADTMLKTNEKLSAAYQFSNSENPYSTLVSNDALRIMNEIGNKKIFKIKFSKKDPFQFVLLAIFIFLWLFNFSFLQISEKNKALGNMLINTSERIDAVLSDNKDKDVEDIADEYGKLGKKIQERFMNEKSIEEEVEKLSSKLEDKVEELSREGINKESKSLNGDENESEVFQLNKKLEMSNDLNNILNSLMKTFSMIPEFSSEMGGRRIFNYLY